MKNKIKILSPGKGCGRTKKIIASIKNILNQYQIEHEIIIIDDSFEFIKYRTWILHTVIINDNVVSRGYKPSKQTIFENLK
ncbi:MAG: hypothetical protein Kow0068_19020 [Marinilabiliales bacterium]